MAIFNLALGIPALALKCRLSVYFACGLAGCWVNICHATLSPQYDIRCIEPAASYTQGVNTKLSGAAFDLDVVLMQGGSPVSSSTVALNPIKSATLELVDTSAQVCLNAPVIASRALVFGANGYSTNRGLARALLVSNAAQRVGCRVTLVSSKNQKYTKCDSGVLQTGTVEASFSVRPAYFSVGSSNANADASGQSTTAKPLLKASTAGSQANSARIFDLTLQAKNIQGNVTSAYTGIAAIDPMSLATHAQDAVAVGTLYPLVFKTAVNGQSSSTFSYSEVGYFKLRAGGVRDNSYTLRDRRNGRCVPESAANTLQAGKYGCDIATSADTAYFGRFVPDSFKLTALQTEPGCSTGSFTYLGGDFSTRFVIEAVNDANVRTRNYHGVFAKFANRSIAERYASYQFTLSPGIGTLALQQGSSPPLLVSAWQQGRAEMRVTHQTTRPATPVAPALVYVQAQPSDGESQAIAAQLLSAPLNMRMGRLRLYNAYGAETTPLLMLAETQYWNGITWTTHSDDSCTVLDPANIWMSFPVSARNHLGPCETHMRALNEAARFVNGRARYVLAAPGYGNDGWVTVGVDFGLAPGAGKQACSVSGQAQAVERFGLTQFLDANTLSGSLATLSFGQYKSGVIYNREHY